MQDGAVVVWVVPWRVIGGVGPGPGFGQLVEDGWGLGAVLSTQGAFPGEMAGLGLAQPPPADGLELMIMPAQRAGVGVGSGPALGVVAGVVEVCAARAGAAAQVHTRAIPDLDVAA